MDLARFHQQSLYKKKATIYFLNKMKRKTPKDFFQQMWAFHDEVFDNIDCLECGNCCKSISPVLNQCDVDRLAKALRMKTAQFEDAYLDIDQDEDRVFKNTPCSFLMADNYCMAYSSRPKACREYPHTRGVESKRTIHLLSKNYFYCPAVFEVVEKLKKVFNSSH